ncbi:MAG: Uncharacterised protein [Formosa sp. Hel3_A1_48]|nr:MAG: Uncharacterised protein [Formosa sp. Hel3_A1_48]
MGLRFSIDDSSVKTGKPPLSKGNISGIEYTRI